MNRDFFNTVLYTSFKFGKLFAVLALIILVFIMICSVIYLLKIDQPKIVTPQFEIVKQSIENENNDNYNSSSDYVSDNIIKKDKTEKKYKVVIENIIKTSELKPFAYDIILTNVSKYDYKYQKQYLEGLQEFISEGLIYIHDKYNINLNNVSMSKQVLIGIIDEYNKIFDNEIIRVNNEEMSQIQEKIIAGSVFVISLLLFIICLFLPLLIKIEENTRYQLDLFKREKHENA